MTPQLFKNRVNLEIGSARKNVESKLRVNSNLLFQIRFDNFGSILTQKVDFYPQKLAFNKTKKVNEYQKLSKTNKTWKLKKSTKKNIKKVIF